MRIGNMKYDHRRELGVEDFERNEDYLSLPSDLDFSLSPLLSTDIRPFKSPFTNLQK